MGHMRGGRQSAVVSSAHDRPDLWLFHRQCGDEGHNSPPVDEEGSDSLRRKPVRLRSAASSVNGQIMPTCHGGLRLSLMVEYARHPLFRCRHSMQFLPAVISLHRAGLYRATSKL